MKKRLFCIHIPFFLCIGCSTKTDRKGAFDMDNYTKNDSTALRVQTLLCDKQEMGEITAEVSLPDYRPEVKRLVRVSATVTPPARYVGAANAELSGSVDFCILYTGNDGAHYPTSHTSEYRIGIPVDLPSDAVLGEGLVCDADILPEPCNARVLAPRKLSVKCRLRARMRIFGIRLIENGDLISDIAAEKLYGSCDVSELFSGVGEPLSLHDEIVCDTQSEDVRVVCADGQVFISEATAGSGCINCRGEVALKLLCAHDSTGLSPSQLLRRIPFESAVEVDGCEVNCAASAFGTCADVSVTVEDGRILCDLSLILQGRAQRDRNLTYVRDAYALDSVSEGRTDFLSVPQSRSCVCANFSLGQTLTAEEAGLRQGLSVVDAHLIPLSAELTEDNGRDILSGKCRVHLTLCDDAGEISSQEVEVPYRYEAESKEVGLAHSLVHVSPISCRARADGERLGIDAELAVSLLTRAQTPIQYLSACNIGEKCQKPEGECTVCFPAPTDTLWSVAKRYHKPLTHLTGINTLPQQAQAAAADSTASLAGVNYLLV